jgi:hypothetical protein
VVCLLFHGVTLFKSDLIIGNVYSLKNVGQKDCRLFFSQAVEENLAPTSQEEK